MNLDKKLNKLPLTKSNPKTLFSLFGSSEVMPMWVADMEFETDHSIQKALIDRISDSGFGYEYKPESFFLAQKNWYQNHYDIELIKEQLLFSPSITTSISVIIENFTSKGDGVIIQPPVFMEFRDVIRNTGRRIVKNSLQLKNGNYKIDFEDLENKTKAEENKVLILCNPHNPVGRVWRKEELDKIVAICKKNNIILISDEIHKDIILFDNKFTSVLQYTNVWNKIIACTSEAKTFNLCGISDSMLIVPNEDLRNSINATFKKYNLGRTNALTRITLETAYTKSDAWLKKLITTIEVNVNLIENALKKANSKITLIKPEGTYQVWLDFNDIYKDSKEMFLHLSEKSKIALNAGHWYGREGALFMRMNIGTSKEKVQKAIGQIINAVL